MKMLFVSAFYPPHHLGGYELLCHEVATRLTARGHQIVVVTSNHGGGIDQEEAGIYRRLHLESDIHYYHPQQVLGYWADRRHNFNVVRGIMDLEQPDLVVVWGMWGLSRSIAVWFEQLAGKRLIYYLSDHWPARASAHRAYWDGTAESWVGRLFKGVLRWPMHWLLHDEWQPRALSFTNTLIGCQTIKDQLIRAGVPIAHARVLYHGIDPAPYRRAVECRQAETAPGSLRAVFVGSLVAHKGTHTAIEAVYHLASCGKSGLIKLTVLGSGHPQYEERLRRMVLDYDLAEYVIFHSPIPRAELPEFLAHFDVLVMPSVYEEPLARISQEAMAAGLVLIATLTGGTKEILVDEENGLAFEPEDAKGLATQLSRLIDEPELAPRLKSAAWETVSERFTIFRMIDQFEAFAREVMA